ncbi:MAG: cation diffusion facilitator family transporter [Anaerolineales bacterium]
MTSQREHRSGSSSNLNAIRTAFFLNLVFALIEIVGGLWTNSVAILADALHDLADAASLGFSGYLEGVSTRDHDRRYSYGYRRYSLLAALTTTLVIVLGSLFVLSEAIPRLFRPEHPNAAGMAGFAVLGIAINGFAAWRTRKGGSMNLRAVTWHLIEDVLGWVAVLAVSLILLVWDVHSLDAVLSILITGYVLYNVARNLRTTMSLFLQAVPQGIRLEELERKLRRLPAVKSIHHTHVWSLDGEHNVVTSHVVVPGSATKRDLIRIKHSFRDLVRPLAPEHTTLEIEFEEEDCSMQSMP